MPKKTNKQIMKEQKEEIARLKGEKAKLKETADGETAIPETKGKPKEPEPVLCPSCLKNGEKVKMTGRGDTMTCPTCNTWIDKPE